MSDQPRELSIRTAPHQDTAVVLFTAPMEELPTVFGRVLPLTFEAVTRLGMTPAGPPFARTFSVEGGVLSMEAGLPVASPFPGEGEVRPGELGGCEVATTWHVGAFDGLPATYAALLAWISSQGRQLGGAPWEVYWTDPAEEPDPSGWRTEILWPLA